MGTLFVVATPIGNLEDVSARAVRVLGSVGLVAAEDTRVARVLLRHLGLSARVLSYNEHNRSGRIPEILAALGEGDVALVTDAGTPAISDPGVELVAAARQAGFAVEAVPGPSAVVTALSVAGLAAREWTFVGFLPRTAGALAKALSEAIVGGRTVVAFESASRLRKTLVVMAEVLGERRIAVCRELTKVHEEVVVGSAAAALAHFAAPRGEIVIVIEGSTEKRPLPLTPSRLPGDPAATTGRGGIRGDEGDSDLLREVEVMRGVGLTQSQAAALLALRYGISRRRAYALWLGK